LQSFADAFAASALAAKTPLPRPEAEPIAVIEYESGRVVKEQAEG
jgi:hypothetical protein